MKRLSYILLFSLLAGLGSANATSDAQQTILINKFKKVYRNLKPTDPARVGVMLRLADLISERARTASFKELESGCTVCTAGDQDRKEALRMYKRALPKIKESQKGKVLAQMGHLYEMSGQQAQAINLYNQVTRSSSSPAAKAAAFISLAEIEFKARRFSTAIKHYDSVIKIGVGRQSLAHYKRAWSLFNLGQTDKAVTAMVNILKTPELLTKGSSGVVAVDEQYKAEVSRDLATFMAKNTAGLEEAKFVFEVSPEKVKISNTAYLANELERLGQQAAAIQVYEFVLGQEADAFKRMGHLIHISQLKKDLRRTADSLENYAEALELWKSIGACNQQECKELKSRLRKYVLDWNHAEKKAPSEALAQAYVSYLNTFTNEVDMRLWLSKIYEQQNKPLQAMDQYKRMIQINLAGTEEFKKDAGFKPVALESMLLANIELAEKAKDPAILLQAQNDYLKLSKKQTKSYEVRYQQAHALYKSNQHQSAADAFKALALNTAGPVSLRKKAADLALDALVLAKNDSLVESWSGAFAQSFPQHKGEFTAINRKAVLNQSAQLASSKDVSGSWEALLRFDTSTATQAELITYYKNKMILAEKLLKLSDARLAADSLLAIKGLTPKDREMVMSKRAWFAELSLDFKTAYRFSQKIKMAELNAEKKSLKLALLAELAGSSATPHYVSYLKTSKDIERTTAIAARLVQSSKTPLAELKKHRATLIKKPELYGDLLLEALAKSGQKPSLKTSAELYKDKVLSNTAAGLFAWRMDYMAGFNAQDVKIKAHQLSSKTQKQLSRSIQARDKMIRQLEEKVKVAIGKKDWSAQVVSMSALARESERFFSEIISLPMPEGLSEQEQMQYMSLLSQQAGPHNQRAQDLKGKLAEFWANAATIENFKKDYQQADSSLQPWVKDEIEWVATVAPETVKPELADATQLRAVAQVTPDAAPVAIDAQTLETARQEVRNQPFNKTVLENLLGMEKQMGRKAMVAYLEGRIETLPAVTSAQQGGQE